MNPRIVLLAAGFPLLLCACGRQEQVREVDWAKAALARNPALEIISTEETSGTFTVRDTTTGALYQLHTNELMAAPLPSKLVQNTAPPAPAAHTDVAAPQAAPAAGASAAQPVDAAGAAEDLTTEAMAAARGAGDALVEGPGYSITRGDPEDEVPAATLEGPGYSITREGPATGTAAREPPPVASNVVRRTDPIICQGNRLMRIDGESIEFSGDAVIAENGCDLYISNARIRAGGVGIIARQARVHIVNSTIGGSRGAYEASDGAEIYVAHSTFAGIGRRFDTATMNDLGGNEYRANH